MEKEAAIRPGITQSPINEKKGIEKAKKALCPEQAHRQGEPYPG